MSSALLFAAVLTAAVPAAALPYDIAYVRQPRYGDDQNTTWPEVAHPASLEPGADLMLLHPNGSEEELVHGGVGAVTDPFVSFDAQWVYYSDFYDVRPQAYNYQRGLPYEGAAIFRINLQSRQIEQLTFQEFTPNTGAGPGTSTRATRSIRRPPTTASATACSTSALHRLPAAKSPSPATATVSFRRAA